MNEHSIKIRAAVATIDEGLAFARYVNVASEGFFSFMLGARAEQIVADAYVHPDHDLSWQYVHFAEREGVIVGMYLAYTAEQHGRASRDVLLQAAGSSKLRLRVVNFLFAPMMRITSTIGASDFYLQFIAVDEKARGEGVGSILMDSFEGQAHAFGAARIALDVSASNAGAVRFYTGRGMHIESQWPRRLRVPGLKFYRMVKVL